MLYKPAQILDSCPGILHEGDPSAVDARLASSPYDA
jgi:hypothetical protein